jgi:LysM repeat protein
LYLQDWEGEAAPGYARPRPLSRELDSETYTAVRGDSYWQVARRLGIPVRDLLDANGATRDSMLLEGQMLRLPKKRIPTSGDLYRVQRGDTLTAIGRRSGCSVAEIKRLNALESDAIRVDQELILPRIPAAVEAGAGGLAGPLPPPPPSGEGTRYVVQQGDTLSAIATRCATTVREIMNLNGLSQPNSIRVGQVLYLPKNRGGAGEVPPPNRAVPAPKTQSDDELLELFDEADLFNFSN